MNWATELFVQAGQASHGQEKPAISPAAVLGNIFIFIIAGHETNANTLLYALLLLACHPNHQKAVQQQLDRVLGDIPEHQWSYAADFPALLDGYVGAVMNETLRLYSVLPFYPKSTKTSQSIILNDKSYTVPANTLCMVNTSATHRNSRYWSRPDKALGDGPPYPVSAFDPSQWIQTNSKGEANVTLRTPKAGTFLPFAEGPRACMGKRFAQAEFCATLATILKNHSVELETEEETVYASNNQHKSTWDKARSEAERKLSDGVGFLLSLKMEAKIPLKLVKRGQEQWFP